MAQTSMLTMTLFMLPLFILALPTLTPTSKLIPHPSTNVLAAKLAFFTSLFPLAHFIHTGMTTTTCETQLLTMGTTTIQVTLTLDSYSTFFMPILLFVVWSIMDFTVQYMKPDLKVSIFFSYLITFTMMMMILVTAENMFQFFIGWEGVGIMSFMLINWWSFRSSSNKAAMQAVVYNRLADIGLIITMAWMVINNTSLSIKGVQAPPDLALIPALGLVLAAAGKSAQFGFHPWLPAAMEGPTPVSALLHSSTMVVAGVFLLIRTSDLLYSSETATTICLFLGAITSLLAATCALAQNDLKKIIAYSTTSQLGLMMISIGLKQPELAFMHISTHAFFKAMLFLCAGTIIHNLDNEQDIRKMGGLKKALPITSSCLVIGSLALSGMPFMAGFYSKDAIIESINTSNVNSLSLAMTLMATILTTFYSLRMIYYVALNTPRILPLSSISENPQTTNPILRLAVGSIAAGLLISSTILPTNIPQLTMPASAKLAALGILMLGLLVGSALVMMANQLPTSIKGSQTPLLFKIMHFYFILHHTLPTAILQISQKLLTHLMDQTHYEALGPKAATYLQMLMSKILTNFHKARINPYLKIIIMSIMLISMLYFSSMSVEPPDIGHEPGP
uniref:NADH-ubiquinone oxidoreductase chain 5 n=1 Tax=Mecistops cataphractus TaxID=184780 RepID=B2WVK7_9SAUR|nr:NADH dehydrogenase subunit 5 [Mecistops cataphractus]ABP62974.1 NADH dehydrogenase subunit 5 [Mecistops cataphractus]QOI74194.1 NADH dehydrogenase subunit 5 [Mecistops cataphractus]